MNKMLITADFGGPQGWTLFNGEETFFLSREAFQDLRSWCPPGTILVVEDAHLGRPRTVKSLAQVYTETELFALYRLALTLRIDIRLFPQAQTPRARHQTGFEKKSDENDVKAIHAYVLSQPTVLQSAKRPPTSFAESSSRKAGWLYKDEVNTTLNVARRYDYKAEGDCLTSFVLDNLEILASQMSDDAKKIFGLYHRKKDGSFYALSNAKGPQLPRLYTLAALLFSEDGRLRLRSDTGRPPGIKWLIKTQLSNSPFHQRGGIARSNMLHWAFRPHAIAQLGTKQANGKAISHYDFSPFQTAEFRALRKGFFSAMKETLHIMRSLAPA
jgi:hypothetical protein